MTSKPENRGKRIDRALWIGVAVLLAMIVLVALSRFGRDGGTTEAGSVQPQLPPMASGSTAPSFGLEAVEGGFLGPQEFRGKVVILDFWATWCSPCKREIPDFVALQTEYGPRGLQILGVALDEPVAVKEFVRSAGINYPVVYGTDEVARLYGGVSGIPTTLVIDQNGTIVRRYEGFRSREVFERDVRQLLSL
jgi:peroxiredoxin